jgi:hypothetical protein
MPSAFPELPPETWIRSETDGQGRPLLRWRVPPDAGRWPSALFLGLWLFAAATWGVGLMDEGLARGDLLSLVWPLATIVLFLVVGARRLWTVLRGPVPECLLFELDRLCARASGALRVPGPAAGTIGLVFPPGCSVREVPREAVALSRLDRAGERQCLLIPHGESEIEIGKGLREPEREWLARVLWAWAGRPGPALPPRHSEKPMPPGLPTLPAESWILVEQPEPDRLCVRWLAHPGRKLPWARGRCLLVLLGVSVWWVLALLVLGVFWLAMVQHLLFGGGRLTVEQVEVAGTAALLGGIVDMFILIGVALLLGFWGLTQPDRPARLTLAPGALIYDPGYFYADNRVISGKTLEIRRPELGEVCLDRVEGRQRLTIDRGVERIEVGAGLREPEREWLAEVLRGWAGPPR